MYNDFRTPTRENWKYTYTGDQLLAAALLKHEEFLAAEKEARAIVAKLIVNIQVSHDNQEMREAKTAIDHNGNMREQCAVFIHEFNRTPKREFNLSLGDVVFFNLASLVNNPEGDVI